MTIATLSDTTRIFIDRTRFVQAMSTATLQGKLNEVNLNAEVFEMAGRVTALSDDHFETDPDELHWGHVGTLNHYRDRLREISDAAFKEGEYAE